MSDEAGTSQGGNGAFVSEGLDPDEIEELRASVAALREHIATRFPRRAGAEEAVAEAPREAPPAVRQAERAAGGEGLMERLSSLEVLDLWDRMRTRLGSLGARDREVTTDDFGLDPLYLEQLRPVLDFLFKRWWRVRVSGVEHLADAGADGRVLYVANRSGVLPYDGLMIAEALARHRPDAPRARFLVADWLVSLPFAQARLARLGGVRACPENAERLLRTARPVIAFPEGQKGALKPFAERYRLQRFGRGGFVSLAIRARVRVVPVGVVGAEEAHPVIFRSGYLERLLGIPLPVTPTFPHLGLLGAVPLPSRWGIRFGEPVRLDELPLERADDPLYINRTREQIRGTIQELIASTLRNRDSVFS